MLNIFTATKIRDELLTDFFLIHIKTFFRTLHDENIGLETTIKILLFSTSFPFLFSCVIYSMKKSCNLNFSFSTFF